MNEVFLATALLLQKQPSIAKAAENGHEHKPGNTIKESKMVEKRKYSRFKIYQMIQMSIGKEHYVSCEGINISKSGMLVKTNVDIDSSARFFLLFEVPLETGNYEIRCEGLAAHVHKVDDGWEVGVSFSDLYEEDEKVLEKYLASLEGKDE